MKLTPTSPIPSDYWRPIAVLADGSLWPFEAHHYHLFPDGTERFAGHFKSPDAGHPRGADVRLWRGSDETGEDYVVDITSASLDTSVEGGDYVGPFHFKRITFEPPPSGDDRPARVIGMEYRPEVRAGRGLTPLELVTEDPRGLGVVRVMGGWKRRIRVGRRTSQEQYPAADFDVERWGPAGVRIPDLEVDGFTYKGQRGAQAWRTRESDRLDNHRMAVAGLTLTAPYAPLDFDNNDGAAPGGDGIEFFDFIPKGELTLGKAELEAERVYERTDTLALSTDDLFPLDPLDLAVPATPGLNAPEGSNEVVQPFNTYDSTSDAHRLPHFAGPYPNTPFASSVGAYYSPELLARAHNDGQHYARARRGLRTLCTYATGPLLWWARETMVARANKLRFDYPEIRQTENPASTLIAKYEKSLEPGRRFADGAGGREYYWMAEMAASAWWAGAPHFRNWAESSKPWLKMIGEWLVNTTLRASRAPKTPWTVSMVRSHSGDWWDGQHWSTKPWTSHDADGNRIPIDVAACQTFEVNLGDQAKVVWARAYGAENESDLASILLAQVVSTQAWLDHWLRPHAHAGKHGSPAFLGVAGNDDSREVFGRIRHVYGGAEVVNALGSRTSALILSGDKGFLLSIFLHLGVPERDGQGRPYTLGARVERAIQVILDDTRNGYSGSLAHAGELLAWLQAFERGEVELFDQVHDPIVRHPDGSTVGRPTSPPDDDDPGELPDEDERPPMDTPVDEVDPDPVDDARVRVVTAKLYSGEVLSLHVEHVDGLRPRRGVDRRPRADRRRPWPKAEQRRQAEARRAGRDAESEEPLVRRPDRRVERRRGR